MDIAKLVNSLDAEEFQALLSAVEARRGAEHSSFTQTEISLLRKGELIKAIKAMRDRCGQDCQGNFNLRLSVAKTLCESSPYYSPK